MADLGFLALFESLLSTSGDELGMLEDLYEGIKMLSYVNLQFIECTSAANSNPPLPFSPSPNPPAPISPRSEDLSFVPFEFSGTSDSLVIKFKLSPENFGLIPEKLKNGRLIPVYPIILTQGINEAQTYANTFGDNSFQEQINQEYLKLIERYLDHFESFQKKHRGNTKQELEDLRAVFQELGTTISQPKKKNANILILGEDITRRMNGGRLTSCKSAKDRTSMSSTLEECTILCQNHAVPKAQQNLILEAMRSEGVRIENVQKNVGVKKYAFNYLQVKTLPRLYRPPKNLSGGNQA